MSFMSFKINRVLSLSLLLMTHTCLFAQSPSKNYVQTKTFLNDDGSAFLRHIDYYDELGFVSETVDVGGNTTQTPVIVRTEYNTQLKPSYQWAPIPSTSLDYFSNYNNHTFEEVYNDWPAYTENMYGDFQELESTCKPGADWYEHPVTMTRSVVPAGVVKKYTVDDNGNLCDNGQYYPYGMLMSATTTDEDGRSVTVYTDFHENTILEHRGTGDTATATYYVYDKYGRLRYVLPPMCQQCGTSELSKYWYRYKYDDRGRCTEKQLPGCSVIKYWYDEANRIQSEQDGHLRSQSLYRNYRYDAVGRLVLQTVNSTRGEATESNAKAVEVKNYYDDYTSCRQDLASLLSIWADFIFSEQPALAVARGRLTATLQTTSEGMRYFELYHYDSMGRVTYKLSAYSDKWLKSAYTAYNFVGDVLSMQESVYKHVEYPKFLLARRRIVNTYHPGTRLLATTTITHIDKNGNTSTQVVSNPSYDVFGNVTANDRPGTAADMTYTYDTLHGWLKGVSSPSGFSEVLMREDAQTPLLSGNIGSMLWRNSTNGEQHRYDYTYDELGRLTDSQYSSSVNGTDGRYDESVTYNANGSITSLLRSGMKNDGTFGLIDDLTITYNGNRLLKVTDDAEALNYSNALDFHDGADVTCEYAYDSNGALTQDKNRGVRSITYDYGHHPYFINMNQGVKPRSITNDYTPDGQKLSSRHVMFIQNEYGNTKKTTTDLYVDGLVLRGGEPLLWQFDGGYVDLDANGATTCWNYYVTDHLGSTRMVVSSSDSIRETVNYYPFGSEMRMEAPAQMTNSLGHPFRFTGKELDKQNGLNMYDFGARWYDVAGVPMWTSIDPLAEKYYHVSPYAYCNNNPVMLIDPDGREVKPDNQSFETIKNTLSPEEQEYVSLNENGYIDADRLSLCESETNNFQALMSLVKSPIQIIVTSLSETKYISEGVEHTECFNPVVIDEDFKDVNFTSQIGNITGENGNIGVTYMPTNGGPGKGPLDGKSVHININPTLSPIGAAESFSHEGYGHARIYVETNGNRSMATHHYLEGRKDSNQRLIDYSIRARKETIKNMQR